MQLQLEKQTILLIRILFAVLIIYILIKLYYYKLENLTTQKTADNNFHTVANLPNKEESAKILSQIKKRLRYLINYCIKNYPTNDNVILLKNRFNPDNVQETSINDRGTSYTIDKGSELHLCLRDKKTMQFHHINLLMFVAIHELAHVMSKSYGHNDEFNKNFIFLLQKASECNVYYPENYQQQNQEFCGIAVTNNPLFI